MSLFASLTCDVDSLASIYKGYGLKQAQGYSGLEVRQGLENLCRFLEPYSVKATLFMVGNDFLNPQNIPYIQAAAQAGHEIANHTMTHAQGFRTLSVEEQEEEIAQMETICEQTIGIKPLGFRAPGWNINDSALPILIRRGYVYDSSVHPTFAAPLLKFLHWVTAPQREKGGRTTLGQWKNMFAPTQPYRTSSKTLVNHGEDGLIEFPISVSPFLRLPFWHTLTTSYGIAYFKAIFHSQKTNNLNINYILHISDFVDFTKTNFQYEMPMNNKRRIPQALRMTWKDKKQLLQKVMDILSQEYEFHPLIRLAKEIRCKKNLP